MDRNRITAAVAAATFALAAAAFAQEKKQPEMTPQQKAEMDAMIKAGTPGAPHKAMAGKAGAYTANVRTWREPAGPPSESTATVTRSMALDGRVMVEEFKGSMDGMPFTGHGMQGYDNVTGKYWSTWNDSLSTGLMVSEGTCDAKQACTFKGSWTDPMTKKLVTSRMTSRWTSPAVEVFEMFGPGKDGKEMKMMEITYTKK